MRNKSKTGKPRDIKFILAEEIVKMYHSEKLAQAKQNL